jgi:glycosyltransferase involved in cell wall biosynthesis
MEIVWAGPLPAREPRHYRWLRSIYWRLGYGWFHAEVEPTMLKQRAAEFQRLLQINHVDAVISIQPDPIAFLRPSVPTVLVHDATFATMVDYYHSFTGLSRRSVKLGNNAYRAALDHASLAVFSSEWAGRSASRDYGTDPQKVHVIEFGANLDNPPKQAEVARFVESRFDGDVFRFLFLGIDWYRKGGPEAVEFIKSLRKMGVPAHLDVVGCRIHGCSDTAEFCTEHGFLEKSKSSDNMKLRKLLEAASFLLMPSHAECFGCAYCEANAFGVPCIGRDTGGVAQIIKDGVNGFLLANDGRDLARLAETIKDFLSAKEKYRKLAESSRSEYERRLNWDRFADRLLGLLRKVAVQ